MYTVYLDWNIITQIKKEPNELFKKFNSIRETFKDDLIFPYSAPHIKDLLKSCNKDDINLLLKQDLDLLNKISKGYFFELDYKTQKVSTSTSDAHAVFARHSENDVSDFLNPDSIFSSIEDSEMSFIGELFKTTWKHTPVDIDFSQMDKYPETKEIYAEYFQRSRIEKNLYNFMLDWSDFMKDLNSKPQLYNELRELFRKSIGLDPNVISNFQDPIRKLNDLLKVSKINRSFDEISSLDYIEDTKNNQFLKSDFAKFCMAYVNLDMAGYRPDNFTPKNVYQNFTNDSHHAYFGAFCDFFVSNEKKLVAKANILYKEFKTETKALLLDDFNNEVETLIVKEEDIESFFTAINEAFKKDFYQAYKVPDDNDNETEIYIFKPKQRIFNYFNLLYIEKKPNSNHALYYLRHVNLNFANFNFFDAISRVVNKCLNAFGFDLEKIGKFNQSDIEQLNDKEWVGRKWILGEYFIYFIKDDASSGIKLVLETMDDEFINRLKKENKST